MNAIQTYILEIFKEIKKVCDVHNIEYYAVGGTCIGAVRHGGFIPWDDDIDIAIPIEQLDKFIGLCRNNLPEYYEIRCAEHELHNMTLFYKIVDKRTTFIEKGNEKYPDQYRGVFVDIMPMAGVPDNKFIREIYLQKLKMYARLNCFRRIEKKEYREQIKGKNRLLYNWIVYRIIRFHSYKYFWRKYFEVLHKHPMKDAMYTGYTWVPTRLKELCFGQDNFRCFVEFPFEDTVMRCPNGYHAFLTQMFGDYMKWPELNERISGHSGFVDLSKPYSYYQRNPKEIQP